jgi:hypothetical protein
MPDISGLIYASLDVVLNSLSPGNSIWLDLRSFFVACGSSDGLPSLSNSIQIIFFISI